MSPPDSFDRNDLHWHLPSYSLSAFGAALSRRPPKTSAGGTATIHAETRLVLVDTVVTDKSGNYIRNLTAKNFKVWEDNKEQPIKSFSSEDDASSPGKAQNAVRSALL